MQNNNDNYYLNYALELAKKAENLNEIPVGAIIVRDNQIIAKAYNQTIKLNDPTAHAEILALRQAGKKLKNYRLNDCVLYVNLKPCSMCSQAILNARIKIVFFGAKNLKNQINYSNFKQINNQNLIQKCENILNDFFKNKRQINKKNKIKNYPLPDFALRNNLENFNNLIDFNYQIKFVNSLSSSRGLRLAYFDEGNKNSEIIWFCIHGFPTFSYIFHQEIKEFLNLGYRVIFLDLLGFGQSDKFKNYKNYSLSLFQNLIQEFLDYLNLEQNKKINLITQGEGIYLINNLDKLKLNFIWLKDIYSDKNNLYLIDYYRNLAIKSKFNLGKNFTKDNQEVEILNLPFKNQEYKTIFKSWQKIQKEFTCLNFALLNNYLNQNKLIISLNINNKLFNKEDYFNNWKKYLLNIKLNKNFFYLENNHKELFNKFINYF